MTHGTLFLMLKGPVAKAAGIAGLATAIVIGLSVSMNLCVAFSSRAHARIVFPSLIGENYWQLAVIAGGLAMWTVLFRQSLRSAPKDLFAFAIATDMIVVVIGLTFVIYKTCGMVYNYRGHDLLGYLNASGWRWLSDQGYWRLIIIVAPIAYERIFIVDTSLPTKFSAGQIHQPESDGLDQDEVQPEEALTEKRYLTCWLKYVSGEDYWDEILVIGPFLSEPEQLNWKQLFEGWLEHFNASIEPNVLGKSVRATFYLKPRPEWLELPEQLATQKEIREHVSTAALMPLDLKT